MSKIPKIDPVLVLRLSLGFMYLYSAQSLIRFPNSWIWAVPEWFRRTIAILVSLESYLKFQGAIELILAIIFLGIGINLAIVKYAALFSAVEMVIIIISSLSPNFLSSGDFLYTFRDLGVFGASFALFLLISRKNASGSKN